MALFRRKSIRCKEINQQKNRLKSCDGLLVNFPDRLKHRFDGFGAGHVNVDVTGGSRSTNNFVCALQSSNNTLTNRATGTNYKRDTLHYFEISLDADSSWRWKRRLVSPAGVSAAADRDREKLLLNGLWLEQVFGFGSTENGTMNMRIVSLAVHPLPSPAQP
jgi:hypothetical protein